jgi:hypothetical protein
MTMPSYKYKKEIADEYGWDRKTFYNKLKEHDLSIGRGLLSPAQQKQVYEYLGYPSGVTEKDYKNVKIKLDKDG